MTVVEWLFIIIFQIQKRLALSQPFFSKQAFQNKRELI